MQQACVALLIKYITVKNEGLFSPMFHNHMFHPPIHLPLSLDNMPGKVFTRLIIIICNHTTVMGVTSPTAVVLANLKVKLQPR